MKVSYMKNLLGTIWILFVFSMASIAVAEQFGAAGPRTGEFSFGIGYLLDQRRWEPSDEIGTFFTFGRSESNQVYPNTNFGFIKNWEAYTRLGATDAKLPDSFVAGDLSHNFTLFGTLCIKGSLFSRDYSSIVRTEK